MSLVVSRGGRGCPCTLVQETLNTQTFGSQLSQLNPPPIIGALRMEMLPSETKWELMNDNVYRTISHQKQLRVIQYLFLTQTTQHTL